MKEKLLSLRIIFPFFEELKKFNFENKVKEIKKQINDNTGNTILKSYIANNENSIKEFEKTEIYQKALKRKFLNLLKIIKLLFQN